MEQATVNYSDIQEYADFLIDVQRGQAEDDLLQIPSRVLRWLIHAPLAVSFELIGQVPAVRTLSIGRSPDRSMPDVLVRRDITPFETPYQIPVAVIPGDETRRAQLAGRCLRHYVSRNGIGSRSASRPLFRKVPSAVMLCSVISGAAGWFGGAVQKGSQVAGFELSAETARAQSFGPDFMARSAQDADNAIQSVFGDNAPVPGKVEPAPDQGEFDSWWQYVSGPDTVIDFLSILEKSWARAVVTSSRAPSVSLRSMRAWLSLFIDAFPHTRSDLSTVEDGHFGRVVRPVG